MTATFDLHGVFVSALLVWVALALALTGILRRILDHADAYRFVWHRPLFDLSLFVLVLGSIVALANAWNI